MADYVTVNYALNQTYNVHKDVFSQVTKKAVKDFKQIELLGEPIITIIRGGEDLEIQLTIKASKKDNPAELIKKLVIQIEEYIYDAIDSKPSNIKVILKNGF